jgi:hypothetical protein
MIFMRLPYDNGLVNGNDLTFEIIPRSPAPLP